jgi:hypothetical protein
MYTIRDNILTFDNGFNQPIDNIIFPDDITTICFGESFNQSLDKVKFPMSLKKIFFSKNYNKPIDKVKFPESLESIWPGCSPLYSIKNANFMKFIKNISYCPESVPSNYGYRGYDPRMNPYNFCGYSTDHLTYDLIDLSSDNIESVSVNGEKVPIYNYILALNKRIKSLESKDFNSEIIKLKSENDQLKEKIDIMTEEINQIKRNNERFDAMDKYYRDRESYITQLLDINIKQKN